ncbi:dynamin family protein [Massilia scottii]|uniref:dynamin family protein n=1 Tax=Massilia scottii TaxID=3057166 RepID=UPI00279658F5|nr:MULTISPECIES: dynamin family protein [unclassified Massilia]MDQ1814649.1 dynamin family protein [Massilia sp. CCM 9210]MDQ1832070.1 dynamin family protein [Massilia sp. CCM 9029]
MVQDFEQYSAWRQDVAMALEKYQMWVNAAELADAATEQRIARALARLADDRLSVAFVAEFSRGKSELINAIFFADYGQRILPSAAGRTTMCPTELMYDPAFPPCIRLLPIETRASNLSTSDYRDDPAAWTVLPLALDAGEEMHETFKQVSMTKHVKVEEAKRYGLFDETDPDVAATLDDNGEIEISLWRHAIINFPHPLLKQGLVILDTPGLNAIGTEPELTLNLIPNAHAVLFILAAETGVTKSDIEVWRTHIGAGAGRIVVMNKIDAMWDELKTEAENDAEIERQQTTVAHMLALEPRQVFPVSAQKALVGKINGDMALLEKSRLGALEAALFNELIPAKQDIIRKQLSDDLNAVVSIQQATIGARIRDIVEQLQELKSLRGKNQGVIAHMMRRVEVEKKEFDGSLFKLQGTRAVFARLSTELYTTLGMDIVHKEIAAVREAMAASRFVTTGIRGPVKHFFDQARANLEVSNGKIAEISEMMEMMYRKFAAEHGLSLAVPMTLSLDKYRKEVDAIEEVYVKQFGTTTLLITSRDAVIERFFDSIASRVRRSYRAANADVEAWLKVIMSPLEAQIRQHKDQLKHRLASIQRIHDATDSLETKIESFEASQFALEKVKGRLNDLAGNVDAAMQRTTAAAFEAAA